MIIWLPFNSLMWIVTWIAQLPRHFADTAELPWAQIKARSYAKDSKVNPLRTWTILVHVRWGIEFSRWCTAISWVANWIYCLPLFATVCDWWKHNQSISFRPKGTGGGNLLLHLFSSDPDAGSRLPWTSNAEMAIEATQRCKFWSAKPQASQSPSTLPDAQIGSNWPKDVQIISLYMLFMYIIYTYPLVVIHHNPKSVRLWFAGTWNNFDPGRSHICGKIFWRPCAIPCRNV